MSRNDPDGKRLARMRADAGAEALAMLSVVRSRIKRLDSQALSDALDNFRRDLRSKSGSHPLELADLAARILHTWVRDGMGDEHEFWNVWAPHISLGADLERGKFGVKIFPHSDIREQTMAFRRRVRQIRNEA